MEPEPLVPIAAPPPRPRWHPALRALLYLVGCLAIQVAAGVLAVSVAWLGLAGAALGPESGEGLLFVTAVTAPAVLALTALFARFLDRRGLASFGARWPDGGRAAAARQAAMATLGTLGALALWLAAALPSVRLRVSGWSPELLAGPAWWPSPAGSAAFLALLLAGFLVQGGLEEWIVRGYVYRALRERLRAPVVAAATSFLFAALHAGNPGFTVVAFANTFLAGLLLAALVERTGSLWAATVVHGVWNFAVSCLASLPVSGVRLFRLLAVSLAGPDLATGGAYGPEGSLLLTPILLAVVLPLCRGIVGREALGAAPGPVTAAVQSAREAQRWSVA